MQIRFMSSNIRYDNPADAPRSWADRKDSLVKSILDFNPLILGTQEGHEPQLRNLLSHLPGYQLADSHRQWLEERMYPCLFYKKDQITCVESGDIWLSETPDIAGSKSFDSAFPRLVTWMRGITKNEERPFFVANVHLDHMKSSTRASQGEVLINQIKPLIREDEAFVLMGDFNESPDDTVRSLLQESFEDLYDPWFILDKSEEISHHNLYGIDKPNGARIDWILMNRKFSPFDIYLDKNCPNEIYPSDHYPVKAILNFR
jgi:endonuclease/exonuclease/phosphatase family metal-dependent hydrolase